MKIKPIPLAIAIMIGFHPLTALAQDSSGDSISTIIETHQKAVDALFEKMRGKSREEQQELYQAEYPKSDKPMESITALVLASPEAPESLEGVSWLLRNSRGKAIDPALYQGLEKHHLNNEKLQPAILAMARVRTPENEAFLTTVGTESTIKDLRGSAIYALMIGMKGDEEKADEHAALSKKLFADHADLEINGRNITKSIKAERDAAEKLAIGKVAPEIIGKDVDGKEMKLSDYRGKVVVLDFWGDW